MLKDTSMPEYLDYHVMQALLTGMLADAVDTIAQERTGLSWHALITEVAKQLAAGDDATRVLRATLESFVEGCAENLAQGGTRVIDVRVSLVLSGGGLSA